MNKNLPELQEKLKKEIIIHEAKPPRKDHNLEEKKKDEDDEFEKVEEVKRD